MNMAAKVYAAMNTGFRGAVNGSIQTVVTDQPGLGVPGELCFASDDNLVDSYRVAGDVFCGGGVQLVNDASGATPGTNFQLPGQLAQLPNATNLTLADFDGIVVFNENCQSNANGQPGWSNGRVARVLRPGRSGGRIWLKAVEAVDKTTATVNWVVEAGTDGLYAAGEFAPAALAGSAGAGYSVAITTAKVISSAAAGGVFAIELG
jgi:hypothetical protein